MNTNKYFPACLVLSTLIAALQLGQELSPASSPSPQPQKEREGQPDFGLSLRTGKTHVSRLVRPLTGSKQWFEYDGTSVVSKVWNGKASLFELDVSGPAGHIQGVGFAVYTPE